MNVPFLKHFVGVKVDTVVQSAIDSLVRWDPKGASEAELRTMEQHLDEVGAKVSDARVSYEREQSQADAIAKTAAIRMAAAEKLQAQIDAEQDPVRKASITASAEALVGQIEADQPHVDEEIQNAKDAKAFLDQMSAAYEGVAAKLRTARSDLERAQRDMQSAQQRQSVEAERVESARITAGLTQSTSTLSTALKSMQDQAASINADTKQMAEKTRLLTPNNVEKDDPTIAAAIAEASGATPHASSLADRLAALKGLQKAA